MLFSKGFKVIGTLLSIVFALFFGGIAFVLSDVDLTGRILGFAMMIIFFLAAFAIVMHKRTPPILIR